MKLLGLSMLGLGLSVGCAEPVVEMKLHMPANAETFDSSCVSAVAVAVNGTNYASDGNDYTWSCQEITSQNRMGGIHDAIRGKFTLDIPASGISGIEIFGLSGPQPCAPPEFVSPDLIFHAAETYIGQDIVDLKLDTTMDCTKQTVNVRPVELFTLAGGASPSSTNCAAAAVPDADQGYASLGQIIERDFSTGVDFWGGFRWAGVSGGVASFTAATTGLGKSCLAYDTESAAGYATGCTMPGFHVCAGATEIDAPFVRDEIANEASLIDEALLAKWDSMVFVSVWDNGNPKKPIAGAKVEVAAADGAVIYIDPPSTGNRPTKRDGTGTGTSGLAIVYTNKLANVKITAGTATQEVKVAAPDWSVGAALVVMP